LVATEFLAILKDRNHLQGNGRICVIQSAGREAVSKYAKEEDSSTYGFDFDIEELTGSSPAHYVEALHVVESCDYSLVIIDQITSEWAGVGGVLDAHSKEVKRIGENFTYTIWNTFSNPRHASFVDALMSTPCHLIACIRAKSKIRIVSGGKADEIGIRPIQRKDLIYEFDAFAMMDQSHTAKFLKGRCPGLDNASFPLPGRDVATILADWTCRGHGEIMAQEYRLPDRFVREIAMAFSQAKLSPESQSKALSKRGAGRIEDLSQANAKNLIDELEKFIRLQEQKAQEKKQAEMTPQEIMREDLVKQIDDSLASGTKANGVASATDSKVS
jgi:hypothetical protein